MKQFHLHSPSEHTIRGKRYDAEIHFVYVPVDGSAGTGPVIGVMLDGSADQDNAFSSSGQTSAKPSAKLQPNFSQTSAKPSAVLAKLRQQEARAPAPH